MSRLGIQRFERAVARGLGARHAIAVNSGTAALHAALVGVGVRPGDEVVIPALSVAPVAAAVAHAGARPIFADVDPAEWTLTEDAVERALTRRTRAVVAVHLFGVPCRMDGLARLAQRRGLALVDDAAQALGGRFGGRRLGTFGEAGVLSFQTVKHLSLGEGGMVLTGSASRAAFIRSFVNLGRAPRGARPLRRGEDRLLPFERVGYNYRMPEDQARRGLSLWKRRAPLFDHRGASVERARRWLGTRPWAELQAVPPEGAPGFLYAGAAVRKGWSVEGALRESWRAGFEAGRWFPLVSEEPAFRRFARRGSTPVAAELAPRVLTVTG